MNFVAIMTGTTDGREDLLIEPSADHGLREAERPAITQVRCNDVSRRRASLVGSQSTSNLFVSPASFSTEKGNLGSSPMLPRINASDQETPRSPPEFYLSIPSKVHHRCQSPPA
jgi:hypothetical protein